MRNNQHNRSTNFISDNCIKCVKRPMVPKRDQLIKFVEGTTTTTTTNCMWLTQMQWTINFKLCTVNCTKRTIHMKNVWQKWKIAVCSLLGQPRIYHSKALWICKANIVPAKLKHLFIHLLNIYLASLFSLFWSHPKHIGFINSLCVSHQFSFIL